MRCARPPAQRARLPAPACAWTCQADADRGLGGLSSGRLGAAASSGGPRGARRGGVPCRGGRPRKGRPLF
eukprot:15446794-Alexandrium_andersonii.AAC.1